MNKLLGIFLLGVVVLLCGQAESKEWVNLISDDVYQYSYEKDSMEKSGKDLVKVWVRWESKDEETRQKLVDQRDTKKELYQDYQGSKQLIEINCSKLSMDVLTSTDYKKNGDTIWSMTFSTRDPTPIPSDSKIDKLAKIVCKKN